MPTAAKLVAAIAFAAVAFLGAESVKPQLPPDTQFGWFAVICAGIGVLCGWLVMGDLAGRKRGRVAAVGYGIRTSATIVFWAVLLFSGREMVLRSIRRRYDGVFSAIEGTFDIMLDYGAALAHPAPVAVLLMGGALGGLLADWAARRWR